MVRLVSAHPIHLVEPTGFGGIFQHTFALGDVLAAAGHDVTIHTAVQHEPVGFKENVNICRCFWWPRGHPHGTGLNVLIAARLVGETLTHLHRAMPRGAIVHVEGGVASGALTVLTLAVAKRRGRAPVYSPHNTFSRRGPLDGLVLGGCLHFAQGTVAYSQMDVATLRSRGARSTLSPLIQLVPEPDPGRVAHWRKRWSAGPDDRVVLFAGVVRPDKRLDVLVRAAQGWPADRRLAVVGQERGHLEDCRTLARELGVDMHAHDEFVPLDDFAAALAAADVVVAPYERASQSGVLSVASQLGTATIASRVGGLAELADRTFAAGDARALATTIDEQLAAPAPGGRRRLDDQAALQAHRVAYGQARAARVAARRRRQRRPPVAFVVWGPVEGRAAEFAAAFGGDHRAFFDFGIVSRRLIPLRYALSAVRTIAYLVRARPRSLIVANPPIFAGIIGLAYARLAGIPMVLDSHPISFGQKANRVGRFFLPIHAALARRVTTTIVGTEELARRVRSWGGRADVVHEAAPPPTVEPSVRPVRGNPPRVLWTGIFAADEPFPAVIEAARLMPEVELMVAGDLRRCPVDPATAPTNVRWLGFLRGEEYGAALNAADAVLALTDDSTSAMRAAAEAVYARKPLIMSDLKHLAALFPEGIRVRNDAAAIAAGVRAALSDRRPGWSPAMRDTLVARWREQHDLLRERLGLAVGAASDDTAPDAERTREAARADAARNGASATGKRAA
jgi:glycosyltransferase involved in cell wall biosynthesis